MWTSECWNDAELDFQIGPDAFNKVVLARARAVDTLCLHVLFEHRHSQFFQLCNYIQINDNYNIRL